jgi:DNA-binding ferritin-like protein (Dps family)
MKYKNIIKDATKKELGFFNSKCKRVIYNYYNDDDFKSIEIADGLDKYINKTSFSTQLINFKILYNRIYLFDKPTQFQKEINKLICSEIIREFEEQNKDIFSEK